MYFVVLISDKPHETPHTGYYKGVVLFFTIFSFNYNRAIAKIGGTALKIEAYERIFSQ